MGIHGGIYISTKPWQRLSPRTACASDVPFEGTHIPSLPQMNSNMLEKSPSLKIQETWIKLLTYHQLCVQNKPLCFHMFWNKDYSEMKMLPQRFLETQGTFIRAAWVISEVPLLMLPK